MKKKFAKISIASLLFILAVAGLAMQSHVGSRRLSAQAIPGGTLDPASITKYVTPLVIPPVMPRTSTIKLKGGKNIDYYEIAVRQFQQQILPAGLPATTVWSYGSVNHAGTFNYPAFTIEAKWKRSVRVKWVNGLVDASGNYLPHLLPVDQTLHWANPPGPRDMHSLDPAPYAGPVPMVTHVHGAHTTDESDGYTEAWYLPAANIPAGYATEGTWYNTFKQEFLAANGVTWEAGTATFQYPNNQRAATLWYHDHTLGMTRLNVYAGPAGFYLVRGGPADLALGYRAPKPNDKPGANILYTEIPIAIQDRSFNASGSLFYPASREFFDGFGGPYIPDSDISPIWNPEFFGNTMVVNGKTWPVLNVEARRYRLRLLNGCNSRFLILQMAQDADAIPGIDDGNSTALPGMFWQIGAEGGFLPAPVQLNELLMSPAERADVIVDFTGLAVGTEIYLVNAGPDEPFGGGVPGIDFPRADAASTGQVMKFVVGPALTADPTLPPAGLILPARAPLGVESVTRQVSLNEVDSDLLTDIGPRAALLGTVDLISTPGMPMGMPMMWVDPITENPALNATEIWEIYNFTMDAHPIHIHEVMFEVVNREVFDPELPNAGQVRPPEAWETGVKDTVIAYPGEITRVKAKFDLAGLYVWHCHIVEHEDNEMMRPYSVGTAPVPVVAPAR